ncbi:N-methyltryptophan oxidase [Stieleria bergensis]|uniref:N-methyltryptophan oxidase n=1 Tax=Stieleria bergensis TaxID=2528025 RepID=A0A517T1L2_9BACT|nr:N-methyltryptophan oxidase [Planctomycetes bacterium SV_7m_r]
MQTDYDVTIIGGGIVGLAQAWMASRRGLSVLLLDRTDVPVGASVRNFGMIWPIGQPIGQRYDTAMRSRNFWLELSEQGVIEAEACGSIHLAHREDELAVLEELSSSNQYPTKMLTAEETVRRSPLANPSGLLAGMYSETELRVDPRTASLKLSQWLDTQDKVTCKYSTPVVRVEAPLVHTAFGDRFSAPRIVICSGSDLQTLYADVLQSSGLKLCKLQMLKTASQANLPRNTPHLASGLTLRHYTAFEHCQSLAALQQRIADETPELDRFGIHVMASAFPSGQVILGDSHEYDQDITPFDKQEIDDLMLRELRKVITLSDWTITERWHGIYAKHPTLAIFEQELDDGVHAFVGPGGAGMTMSFGLAQNAWDRWM